jgi:hypothetical protein
MKTQLWLVVTIQEPFPVNFGHTYFPSESDRVTAKGPFYASPVRRYLTPDQRKYAEWSAAELRKHGWTVTVKEEQP